MRHAISVFSLLAILAVWASAQTAGTGTIIGTAIDPSGAVIPAAKIELRDVATATVRSSACTATTSPAFCWEATVYNVKQIFGFVVNSASILEALAKAK